MFRSRAERKVEKAGFEIAYKKPYDHSLRESGLDWPSRAESMIGLRRMTNIQECIARIIADDVPGDPDPPGHRIDRDRQERAHVGYGDARVDVAVGGDPVGLFGHVGVGLAQLPVDGDGFLGGREGLLRSAHRKQELVLYDFLARLCLHRAVEVGLLAFRHVVRPGGSHELVDERVELA